MIASRSDGGQRARWTPLLDLRVPMDIVVYTPDEFARLRHWKSSVAGIADREGRVLRRIWLRSGETRPRPSSSSVNDSVPQAQGVVHPAPAIIRRLGGKSR